MPPPEPVAVSVADTATRLGFGRQRVYDLLHAGWLKALPGPGKKMILVESIEQFIEQGRAGGPDPHAAVS